MRYSILSFWPLMSAIVEGGEGGGSTAVRPEVYGVRIRANLDAGKVKALTDSLLEVAGNARKAQKVIDGKRRSVADEMLGLARKCSGRDEWNQAYDILKGQYQAHFGPKEKLPPVMVQTGSDIKRFFDSGLKLDTTTAEGELLSYSALKKMASKIKSANAKKIKDAIASAMPPWAKDFDTQVSLLRGVFKSKDTERYPESNPIIEEVNEAIKEVIAKHRKVIVEASKEQADETASDSESLPVIDADDDQSQQDHRSANVG